MAAQHPPSPMTFERMSADGPPPVSAATADAVGQVHRVEGSLIAVEPSGAVIRLGAGDGFSAGDVLITWPGSTAALSLPGGATLTMAGSARIAIHGGADPAQAARIVVLSGAFILAGPPSGGEEAAVRIETPAAELWTDGAAVAFSYELAAGLRAAVIDDAAGDGAVAHIVNASGSHLLAHAEPAVVVGHWGEEPQPGAAAAPGALPEWICSMLAGGAADAGGHDPGSALAAASADGSIASALGEGDGHLDAAPAFSTGAGMPADGDTSFLFPPTSSEGLADHAVADAAWPSPMAPEPAQSPALRAYAARAAMPEHAPDALLLYPPPTEIDPPLPPRPPGPPQLRGWESGNHVWDYEGLAWVSGGDREWPGRPDQTFEEIQPRDGESMAALAPQEGRRADLEAFLGLQDHTLDNLVEGTIFGDGSAIRTSITLKAGQTLVFDVRFDALQSLPRNDFAAFTVAHGDQGEAFVFSSIEATGSFGVTPWQTLAYRVGAAGAYTLGFVVINDDTPLGPSRLYVDGLHGHLDSDGLALLDSQTDCFGGHFTLLEPKSPAPEPGAERLVDSFESRFTFDKRVGSVDIADHLVEPDGAGSTYMPTDGETMAVLRAFGASRAALESFLGLEPPPGAPTALPFDSDGSAPTFGAATRLSVEVAAGDRVSFDWMFDAGDTRPDNDFAIFTVAGEDGATVFRLADVRTTGDEGASGWRTSVFTAAEDGALTLGSAVVNDRLAGYGSDHENSRLLIDNVRLNRDFGDGYQTVDLPDPGAFATLPLA